MKLRPQLFLSMMLLFASCTAQVKPLGEQPLQLKSFDFGTKITEILPDKYKSKTYADHYNLTGASRLMIQKEMVYDDRFDTKRKAKWIEYRNLGSYSNEVLVVFDKFEFNTINLVTTLDNQLMLVNGVITEVSKKQNNDFIKSLDKLYGKNIATENTSFGKPHQTYTWKLKDRTIKYSVVNDDESNTLKVEAKTLKSVPKESHLEGYLFVIDKKYEDLLVGNMNTGDLPFCK